MSWDVLILKASALPLPKDLDDAEYLPLGPAAEVRQRISTLLPGIDWTDTSWGVYTGETFLIEFNTGGEDPIENIMLHVRGGGDVMPMIMAIIRPQGWSAFDCSMGEFLDPQNPSAAGWEGFQGFRVKVIDELP